MGLFATHLGACTVGNFFKRLDESVHERLDRHELAIRKLAHVVNEATGGNVHDVDLPEDVVTVPLTADQQTIADLQKKVELLLAGQGTATPNLDLTPEAEKVAFTKPAGLTLVPPVSTPAEGGNA